MESVIEAVDLTREFGAVRAVDGLTMTVRKGEIYGLLGLNGAGKTTTIQMMTGGLPPTRGQARVLGVDSSRHHRQISRHIGVVFGENLTPEPRMSPIQYLRHIGAIQGLRRTQLEANASGLLELLTLSEVAERPIAELSGGNRRKVELARALLHDPQILFLDEPTRELDITAKTAVWRFLQDLVRVHRVTIFLSSHDPHEIALLCSRVGVLRAGRLAIEESPRNLMGSGQGMAETLSDLLAGEEEPIETGRSAR